MVLVNVGGGSFHERLNLPAPKYMPKCVPPQPKDFPHVIINELQQFGAISVFVITQLTGSTYCMSCAWTIIVSSLLWLISYLSKLIDPLNDLVLMTVLIRRKMASVWWKWAKIKCFITTQSSSWSNFVLKIKVRLFRDSGIPSNRLTI